MSPGITRRPVVGLLLSTFFDGYEEATWRHVLGAAEEADVDLLAFLVGPFEHDRAADALLEVVGPENVDGVIALSGSLGWASGPARVAERLARLRGLPRVSLSEDVGAPRLEVDNAAGIAGLVDHLARAHGRRRIAFLAGPPASRDAQERLQGYRDGLAGAGLPLDPDLVLQGDFMRPSARDAIRRLEGRPLPMDAIVCGNDAMALAVLDELRRRGCAVPEDVAVTGFDDIADAASAAPALTTARQPLLEMSREAVRLVLAQLEGAPAPPVTRFPAELLLRGSCGCQRLRPAAPAPPAEGETAAEGAGALAAALERELPGLGGHLGAPAWAAELSAALSAALEAEDDRPWTSAVERLLARGLGRVPEPEGWLQALRCLVAWARPRVPAERRERLARLHADANALVASMAAGVQLTRRVRAEEQARGFRRLVQPVPRADDVFLRDVLGLLEALEVRSCFVSRFLDAARTEAALVAQLDLDGIAELEESPATFAPRRLVPGRFTGRRRRAHAVLPVSSPDGLVGMVVCEMGAMSIAGHEILMHELSMVLSVNDLMAELRDQQHQLVETARQAGMAEVAVGALHDVGNLLSSVSVSAEEIAAAAGTAAAAGGAGLEKAAALLAEHAGDLPGFFARDPRAAQIPAYLARAHEALGDQLRRVLAESRELVERTGLVRDSVRALQDHARGGGAAAVRELVDLPELVRVALEIQRGQLDRWQVQVRQELGAVPPLAAPRSRLVHVLVNLVKNGVEAMRSTPEGQRLLSVTSGLQPDGRIRLEVRDTGEGIAPEHLERIFAYGFTTKPDGHGFGLHTCATYVRQMGGALTVTSEGRGRGTCFTLVLDPGPAVTPPLPARG